MGPSRKKAKRDGSFFPFEKKEKLPSNCIVEEEEEKRCLRMPWWRSSSLSSQRSEERKGSHKDRWGEVTQQFHEVGLLVRDKKDSWHKSIKECQKREDELVSLTMEFKSEIMRGQRKKGKFIQIYEMWVTRCAEVRRAEDAARKAENIFKMNFEKCLAAQEVEEEQSKDVTEKVWQAIMEADLTNLLLATKKCGWAKVKEDTARLWAEKK